MSNKAVFMGRMGTIHRLQANGITSLNPETFQILPGVIEGLCALGSAGYFLAVVENEKDELPGIDYPARIREVERYISTMIPFPMGFETCFHKFQVTCDCRLPKIGLIQKFQEMYDLDLSESIMIASREREAKAGINVEIGTVRVSTGRGDWKSKSVRLPIFDSMTDIAAHILEHKVESWALA
jgi:D-glycero-D-manno-heptose 1,7-bisphosphate phosphatase